MGLNPSIHKALQVKFPTKRNREITKRNREIFASNSEYFSELSTIALARLAAESWFILDFHRNATNTKSVCCMVLTRPADLT